MAGNATKNELSTKSHFAIRAKKKEHNPERGGRAATLTMESSITKYNQHPGKRRRRRG